jgi:hypothetical protein
MSDDGTNIAIGKSAEESQRHNVLLMFTVQPCKSTNGPLYGVICVVT